MRCISALIVFNTKASLCVERAPDKTIDKTKHECGWPLCGVSCPGKDQAIRPGQTVIAIMTDFDSAELERD